MKKEKGRWITVKGTHVFIKDGQTVGEAIQEMKKHSLTRQENFAIMEGRNSVLTDSQGFYRANTSYESIKAYQYSLESDLVRDMIERADIQIGNSLGAAAVVDDVLLPNGRKGKLKQGSVITKVVTFAGKGTNKPVKIANSLSQKYKEYNVTPSEWQKTRGEGVVVCDDGICRRAELHWFESQETGRVEMKVKRYF